MFSSGDTNWTDPGLSVRFFDDKISVGSSGNVVIGVTSSATFTSTSTWYHIVLAVDSTQATSSNRVKIFVGGSQITALSSAIYPSQNYDFGINNTSYQTNVGTEIDTGTLSYYLDGYLSEVHFIDGQFLTPAAFAETNSATGVWSPKAYSGTYGTNGFFLNFSDNSASTAAAIGKDFSGNGNNLTPTNISLVAGVTYDSTTDVPP